MKKITVLLLAVLFSLSLSGCNDKNKYEEFPDFGLTSSGLEVEYYDDDGLTYTDIRNDILKYTNIERTQAGLTPLTGNDMTSTLIAFQRASESAIIFEHQRPDGRNWDTVAPEYGIENWIAVGENLGKGFPTAKEMVEGWMNSPDHKENIMGNFTHMGVGVYVKDGIYYYTQFFVRYKKLDENGNPLEDIYGNPIEK